MFKLQEAIAEFFNKFLEWSFKRTADKQNRRLK
jgi:hypothetical protein